MKQLKCPIHAWKDKQTRAHSFYRMLPSNKKEHATDTYYIHGWVSELFFWVKGSRWKKESAWSMVAHICKTNESDMKIADPRLPGRMRGRGQGKEIKTLGRDVLTVLAVVMASQVSRCTKCVPFKHALVTVFQCYPNKPGMKSAPYTTWSFLGSLWGLSWLHPLIPPPHGICCSFCGILVATEFGNFNLGN